MHLRPSLAIAMMLVTAILALTVGSIRYYDLETENIRLTRALHQARTEPPCPTGHYLYYALYDGEWRCRAGEHVIDTGAVTDSDRATAADEARAAAGDITGIRVAPEPPEPSQAELEARQGITLGLRWDPLRRCVPGIPATRWLTQHGDGVFEWPAGIGCGP